MMAAANLGRDRGDNRSGKEAEDGIWPKDFGRRQTSKEQMPESTKRFEVGRPNAIERREKRAGKKKKGGGNEKKAGIAIRMK